MSGGLTPPQMVNSAEHGGMIVRHREYIGDISGTESFLLTEFALNPGLQRTFPWLSQIAGAFEQYRWRGLIFEYKSTCSDAILATSTTPGIGTVIMGTDYNVNDGSSQFVDKLSMENAEFSNSAKPSMTFIHPIECAPSQSNMTKFWVRKGGLVAGQDQKLYDIGTFGLATTNFPVDSPSIGELWATYEVELYKSKFSYAEAQSNDMDVFFLTTGVTNTVPFGANSVVASNWNDLGGTINAGGTVYTLPVGVELGDKFRWTYSVHGDTVSGDNNTVAECTVTLGTGLTGLAGCVDASAGDSFTKFVTVGTQCLLSDICVFGQFSVTSITTTLTFAIAFTNALPSGTDLRGRFEIFRLPENYSRAEPA